MSEEQVNLEKRLFNENLRFASNSVDYKQTKSTLARTHTVDSIARALEDPVKNYKTLHESSLYLSNISGTYNRLLYNFAYMVNYDMMLKPTLQLINKSNKNNLMKYYYESANLIEKINPKHNFKWMAESLWTLGELYIYEIEDKDSMIYKKMPEQICRISSVQDGICRYSIDLSALNNNDLLATMPPDIQNIYKKYKAGTIKKELLIDGKWYELDKRAVAFNMIDSFLPKGYPFLSPIFIGLMALENENRKISDDSEIDNLKIIHMEYECDEEGNSIIDPKLITQFHESVKRNLPDGTCVATNPLKMNVYNTKNTAQATNYRKETSDIVFNSVGTSKELFNGERSSNEAIAMSVKSDEIFALSIIGHFENYLNYKLRQNKKTSYWNTKILPTTYYNETEYKRQCETSLSFTSNSNILKYLAACGNSPLEAMTLLQIESDMGLGDLFKPAVNSYNASGKELTDNGRPSKKDKVDESSNSTTAETE